MRKFFFAFCLVLLAAALFSTSAFAHFGLLIPSSSTVMNKKAAKIKLDIAFSHPFSQNGMKMEKPKNFFLKFGDDKIDLMDRLNDAKYMNEKAFSAEYDIVRPGVYIFALSPEPYYEDAEDSYIIHYTKTVVGAFGNEDGWNEPLGLPMEIIPLSRPFANYAGNAFTGVALKNGKPLANCPVEVEFLNSKQKYEAPNDYFETQTVLTDSNGVFTFSVPWAGWWGFAALADADEKMPHNGQEKDVELGGVIWVEFTAPKLRK